MRYMYTFIFLYLCYEQLLSVALLQVLLEAPLTSEKLSTFVCLFISFLEKDHQSRRDKSIVSFIDKNATHMSLFRVNIQYIIHN